MDNLASPPFTSKKMGGTISECKIFTQSKGLATTCERTPPFTRQPLRAFPAYDARPHACIGDAHTWCWDTMSSSTSCNTCTPVAGGMLPTPERSIRCRTDACCIAIPAERHGPHCTEVAAMRKRGCSARTSSPEPCASASMCEKSACREARTCNTRGICCVCECIHRCIGGSIARLARGTDERRNG